ncbi:MAG: ABC transporter ATP-binding protein [Candidatus Sumerlaeota bacterium]|nr:ABC transporter ATP-binding protein [Candidatus Sumerlaeota bacterium]
MSIIATENIAKIYNMGETEVRALDGVTFRIEPGEMTAMIGASGSGKTTLLSILGCLDRSSSGHYFLDGRDVSNLHKDDLARVRNRQIGFVFQNFNLLPRMTALENVEVPLLYGGWSNAKDRSFEALKRVGLANRAKHEPNQLSGGQRQRLALARALVTEPSIILADEPTGNLDSRTSEEILDLFAELNATGVTLLVVTHEHMVAEKCRRTLQLRDGRIVSDSRNGDRQKMEAEAD